ncbi:Prestin [Holothuria leucospilota]|uniref:Prestin n=1 Tax=Holothuria leucospilota TaxID=206669 RepID=A0A9Q1HHQ1_HOLLE|nr:Prestin [Holothuria leucospilota]
MMRVNIDRPTYSDESLRTTFGKGEDTLSLKWQYQIKQKLGLDEGYFVSERIKAFFPILSWLLQYKVNKQLLGDLLAGITIAVVNVPQGMAFAALTFLPPVYGLYISFFPVIVYVLMGSCHHQSWGGFGVSAIMSGAAVSRVMSLKGETLGQTGLSGLNTSVAPATMSPSDAARAIDISITITLLVGLIQCLMGFLHLGFVSVYLSKSFIQALTTGAAFHVATSQVQRVLGIEVERHSDPFGVILIWIDIFSSLTSLNWATVVVSTISFFLLVFMTLLNAKLKNKLIVPIPMDMIVVILMTVLSYFLSLHERVNVEIVDHIPLGFPQPSLPSPSLFLPLLSDAFAIAIVTYAVDVSLGKTVAEKHNYKIDDNQELIASGFANSLSSFFRCYVSGPSLSRIWILEKAGGSTQLSSAFNCVVVLLIMLFLGHLLEPLPVAVLAVLLIFSLKEMFLQVRVLPVLFRQSKWDFAVWVFTCTSVILLGVALGLLVSLVFSFVTIVLRIQFPTYKLEGMIEGSELFADKKVFKIEDHSKCSVFRMETSLCFLNAQKFRHKLMKLTGLQSDLTNVLMQPSTSEASTDPSDTTNKNGATVNTVSMNVTGELTSQPEEDIRCTNKKVIIINCTSFSFVDYDGAKMLAAVIEECKQKGVTVLLANCTDIVRDAFLRIVQSEELAAVFYPSLIDAFCSQFEQ